MRPLQHAMINNDTLAGEFCEVLNLSETFGDLVQCGGNYSQYMADFNGTSTVMSLPISGWAENESFILSFWMYVAAAAAGNDCPMVVCRDGGATDCAIYIQNGVGTALVSTLYETVTTDFDTNNAYNSGLAPVDTLHHYLASYNATTKSLNVTLYQPGSTDKGNTSALTNGPSFDLCDTFRIGARGTLTRYFQGSLGDLWYLRGTFADVTDDAVIAKFRDGNNNPVNPGASGTGYGYGTPHVFLSTETAWTTGANQGSLGGTFS